MYNNNYTQLINICMKDYENMNKASKPYRALNMIVSKTELPAENEVKNETETKEQSGYITVRVYTALGALPVSEAVVTVYSKDKDGGENAIVHLVSDANGSVPNIKLPVKSDPTIPSEMQKYNFSTYNMRIEAPGYYPVNILDLRVFPGIGTNYKVDLIPVMAGTEGKVPEQTIIIPPPPIESTIK